MSCAGDPLDVLGRPGPWLDLTLKKTIGWSSSPQYAPLIGTFIIGGQFHCRKHSYSYTGWWRWSSPSSHLIRLCSLMLRYWLRTIISQSFVRNSGRQGMKSVSIVFWLHLNLSEIQTNEQKKRFCMMKPPSTLFQEIIIPYHQVSMRSRVSMSLLIKFPWVPSLQFLMEVLHGKF